MSEHHGEHVVVPLLLVGREERVGFPMPAACARVDDLLRLLHAVDLKKLLLLEATKDLLAPCALGDRAADRAHKRIEVLTLLRGTETSGATTSLAEGSGEKQAQTSKVCAKTAVLLLLCLACTNHDLQQPQCNIICRNIKCTGKA